MKSTVFINPSVAILIKASEYVQTSKAVDKLGIMNWDLIVGKTSVKVAVNQFMVVP